MSSTYSPQLQILIHDWANERRIVEERRADLETLKRELQERDSEVQAMEDILERRKAQEHMQMTRPMVPESASPVRELDDDGRFLEPCARCRSEGIECRLTRYVKCQLGGKYTN